MVRGHLVHDSQASPAAGRNLPPAGVDQARRGRPSRSDGVNPRAVSEKLNWRHRPGQRARRGFYELTRHQDTAAAASYQSGQSSSPVAAPRR